MNRTRWLADVAAALDRASAVTLRIGALHAGKDEPVMLLAQITALRGQVESLSRGSRSGVLVPWSIMDVLTR